MFAYLALTEGHGYTFEPILHRPFFWGLDINWMITSTLMLLSVANVAKATTNGKVFLGIFNVLMFLCRMRATDEPHVSHKWIFFVLWVLFYVPQIAFLGKSQFPF